MDSPASTNSNTHQLSSGELLLDRYRIGDLISLGGSSAVYRAEDERLARAVCVKVLRPGAASEGIERTTLDHFVQEAFALSRLAHPNTLRIYDFGHLNSPSSSKTPFQVIEYIDGGTLAERVRAGGPFDEATTARLVTALAGALSEAHNTGIVHRDVKPTNILLVGVDQQITPKLADFGIAKTRSGPDTPQHFVADATEIVAGQDIRLYSRFWSAPEQFLSLGVTPAADVYSLALVTVFMLSGRVTLRTDDNRMPLMMRKNIGEHLHKALEGCAVRESIMPLLEDACAFDLEGRINNVQHFAARLRQALVGDVVIVGESLIESCESVVVPASIDPRLQDITRPSRLILTNSAPSVTGPAPSVAEPVAVRRDVTTLDAGSRFTAPAPITLEPTSAPISLVDRMLRVVTMTEGSASVIVDKSIKLRVTLITADREQPWVHLKGLNCFIHRPGGRPSLAVHAQRNESFELMSTDRRILGNVRLHIGIRDARHHNFDLANQQFVIDAQRYRRAVALDFGPGASCVFIVASP